VLAITESVCPECLAVIRARRVVHGDAVYLEKECPQHGAFRTVIWRGAPEMTSWVRPKIPASPSHPFTAVEQGCPYDCGLCPDHHQQPCCVLLDVTQRCDLACTFCFASAGRENPAPDPSLAVIEGWYRRLLEAGGPFNIQLSGGEPCMRDDLPEIIALGKSLGFTFFQVNTNGVRLARDLPYFQRLVQAGLSTVYLQFDGTNDAIYRKMRGANLLALKQQVIERCAELGVGLVLVPVLVPGINTDNIGEILRLGLDHAPAVRGVHFQPVSYFGRYPSAPRDEDRITIPEVIRAIEEQTYGRIPRESFRPPGGENALCSFHARFVIMPNGDLKPLTHHEADAGCCGQPERLDEGGLKSRQLTARQWSASASQSAPAGQPASASQPAPGKFSRPMRPTPPAQLAGAAAADGGDFGEWDALLARLKTHTFSISGMAFQDAWTLDLERLRDCYIIHVSPQGGLIPFCAYNLTDRQGRSIYRRR
jgi:uncharacterized radical SAM superfamily Fe-S cluster-containing enzyme